MKAIGNEGFVKKVKELTNDNYELLTEYKNNLTPIQARHKKCGRTFTLNSPYTIFKYKDNSCPYCSNMFKRTTETFIEEVKDKLGDNYKIVGEYESGKKAIEVKCLKCDKIFYREPQHIKRKGSVLRCPYCCGHMKGVTTEKFKERVKVVYGDLFEVIGEYKNAKTKVKFKCNNCENIFDCTPDNLISKNLIGCPKCSNSRGEKKISKFLDLHGIKYKQEYTFKNFKDKNSLRFDFGVFDNDELLFLIEYDGVQHFNPTNFNNLMSKEEVEKQFKDTQKKDKMKNDYCLKNNIKLLRIKYTKLNKVEEILTQYITDNTVLNLNREV